MHPRAFRIWFLVSSASRICSLGCAAAPVSGGKRGRLGHEMGQYSNIELMQFPSNHPLLNPTSLTGTLTLRPRDKEK